MTTSWRGPPRSLGERYVGPLVLGLPKGSGTLGPVLCLVLVFDEVEDREADLRPGVGS